MTDEQFETAVRELLVIASFHGEATDPSVQAVIEEARNGRAAMVLLDEWQRVGSETANYFVWVGEFAARVQDLLTKAGRQ